MGTPAPTFTRYRVAAIQYEPTLGEKEQNVTDLLRLVEQAAQHDARLIVLPEMATTGYCWESRAEVAPYVEPIPGPTTDRFQQLATQYDCYVAVSLAEVDPATNVYYNGMALIGPQGLIGTYRKIHSYISEPRWARDGDLGMPVWETPLGRLAGLICMDAAYFEAARIPALHNADVLLFPTNWLDEKCPSSWWMARAFENGVYFIAADRYGLERGVQFSGGSCVIDPDGVIQNYLDSGEGIVYGEVDLSRSRNKNWGSSQAEAIGDRLADRHPAEYLTLVNNTYLWEPLRYHGLYEMGELPAGQLSCVGIMQTDLQTFLEARAGPFGHTSIYPRDNCSHTGRSYYDSRTRNR
jgi:predicted amidohydrolase